MLAYDRGSLICDLAETYNIYNYKELPVDLLATLATGLRENSRIKMKMGKRDFTTEEVLLAHIADNLSLFRYGFSEEAQNGTNTPKLFTEIIYKDEKEKTDITGFITGEDFEAEMQAILERI